MTYEEIQTAIKDCIAELACTEKCSHTECRNSAQTRVHLYHNLECLEQSKAQGVTSERWWELYAAGAMMTRGERHRQKVISNRFRLASPDPTLAGGGRTDGAVACWGLNLYGRTRPPKGVFPVH